VDDAIAVALEGGAVGVFVFGMSAAFRVPAFESVGGEGVGFVVLEALASEDHAESIPELETV